MPATLPVSYTSVALIYEALSELGSRTTLTSAQVAAFAGRVEAGMNARLARAYALPFARAVPALQDIATDLAIYRLLSRVVFTGERLGESPWPARYKEASEALEAIARGRVPLLDSSGALIPTRAGVAEVWSTTQGFAPTFAEDGFEDSTINADKLAALREGREG
ncbi:MAG: DUF1320 family protein [Proteobacteria bacterium]|nr:DUF1320 family protein [Pseudomonadota bacterium]